MNFSNSRSLRISAVSVFLAAAAFAQSENGYSKLDLTLFGGYNRGYTYGNVAPLSPPNQPPGPPGNRRFGEDAVFGVRLSQQFHRFLSLEEGFTYAFLPVSYMAYSTGAQASLDARTYRFTVNPVLHFTSREARIRPYATAGIAMDWYDPHAAVITNVLPDGSSYLRDLDTKVYPHLAYGFGVKFNLSRHIAVQLDARDHWGNLPHFGLPDQPTSQGAFYSAKGQMIHQVELTGGLAFRFRYKEAVLPPTPPPPPPPAPAPIEFSVDRVTASAASVCPGANVALQAITTGVPDDATYRWTVNGAPIRATGNTATVNTTGMSGRQNVTVTVASGQQSKSGSTSFEMNSAGNPTIRVGVSPDTIPHGASATISPVAAGSACGGEVRVSCTSSEGTVTGNTFDSTNIAFDPNETRPQSKNVTITCTATDTLLAKATANATIAVTDTPHVRRLDDLVFAKNSARVNNCAKRLLLEEATALLRENPDWTLVLVGHRDEQETGKAASALDTNRAMNAAAVLSAGVGICPVLDPSRVKVIVAGTDQAAQTRPLFCGTSSNIRERSGEAISSDDPRAQFRRVEVWLIPSGADIPEALKSATPVEVDALKKRGCPK